jgi:hypothetical protein
MLGNLMYQHTPPDETLVYVSGVPPAEVAELREDFPHARFTQVRNMEDWGHAKRARGLHEAKADVVGFFNDDDEYDDDYTARMLDELQQGADVVFCNWSYSPAGTRFDLGSSTSGNFLVRTKVAKRVGWAGRGYCADGDFINALKEATDRIVRVDDVLYRHNPGG